MTIRFLQTTPSEIPNVPFMAGQVINVPVPSLYLRSLIDGVRAELVRSDETERAVEPTHEQPEPVAVKRSRRVAKQH